MTKNLYIKTFGCQMNVYDSEKMESILKPLDYSLVLDPEIADLVILNTCHIREKASEKLFSDLGKLKKIQNNKKSMGKDLLVAVGGCVAQAQGEEIIKRAPNVSIVFGPQSYHKLPKLIESVEKKSESIVDIGFPTEEKFESLNKKINSINVSEYLTIQEGCNKFCTFCVVPYTRGVEYSRPIHDIIREAQNLVLKGAKEIVLLGQNVNAYHGKGPLGKDISFDYLISSIAEIESLERIRFTTSHPIDMSKKLILLFGSLPKLMPMLHLPVQSGSDRVLKLMNRKHTIKEYLDIIESLRSVCPDIAFSSDFIVGYPGETEKDFEETIKIVNKVKFAQSFSFKYSPRLGTPAASESNQIDEKVKSIRLTRLQTLLAEQQLAYNKIFEGKKVNVLFEKKHKSNKYITGRSQYMQLVHTELSEENIDKFIGKTSNVYVNKATPHNLHAEFTEEVVHRKIN
ncbi:tRNA (N6-isopentenyl adenosine(37)-C2)-methylthiotransferase MiaB [Alphaproteobacteria bacterium]|nr:tRNA (N6-isopentenyl adenosine(37)-C2)-methylthiotransferase MiaB [Alphaproteobacteria bacterium]